MKLFYEPPNGHIFMDPDSGKRRNEFVGLAESLMCPLNSLFIQDPT